MISRCLKDRAGDDTEQGVEKGIAEVLDRYPDIFQIQGRGPVQNVTVSSFEKPTTNSPATAKRPPCLLYRRSGHRRLNVEERIVAT